MHEQQESMPVGCQLPACQPFVPLVSGGARGLVVRAPCTMRSKLNKFEHIEGSPCMVKSNVSWLNNHMGTLSPTD